MSTQRQEPQNRFFERVRPTYGCFAPSGNITSSIVICYIVDTNREQDIVHIEESNQRLDPEFDGQPGEYVVVGEIYKNPIYKKK